MTLLLEYDKNTKEQMTQKPSITDIVVVFEEKQPQNKWMLGRVVELINKHDSKTRGVTIMMSKTKTCC